MNQTPFDQFWQRYPKHVGRKKAEEKFKKALKATTLDTILAALAWQTQQPSWLKDDGEFIPHAATWLHNERWTDEQPAARLNGTRHSAPPPLVPICAYCKRTPVDRVGNYCDVCKQRAGLLL